MQTLFRYLCGVQIATLSVGPAKVNIQLFGCSSFCRNERSPSRRVYACVRVESHQGRTSH
jgi:hypothetical protein